MGTISRDQEKKGQIIDQLIKIKNGYYSQYQEKLVQQGVDSDLRKSSEDKGQEHKGSSFLNLPIKDQQQLDSLSPDIKNKQSRNISQNISSFGTSQINNYQISQIDKFKRFPTERKEQRNNTVDTQKKERETSPNQKIFIKQTTTKTERKMAFFEIDNDYRDYDHIDQIASEEVKIVFSNIIPNLGRHKSTLDL
ncbi:unnamed protein product [Paramecium primaurelia]|uniref:Uncharacterized protein n=1 Tax=Paramecium primaurelia TaxID=5886 RepID=A0A8S1LPV2_PARPR|nr:unnamed protein product [Paramecium primaurelia]CAD8068429.1 unnamed protein product [Paramecium primaurelia]